jgi:hypothetical protein
MSITIVHLINEEKTSEIYSCQQGKFNQFRGRFGLVFVNTFVDIISGARVFQF